jgi:hypothetical protein
LNIRTRIVLASISLSQQKASTFTTPSGEASPSASTSPPSVAAPLASHPDWQEATDKQSGRIYYYNVKTGVTSWDLPSEAKQYKTIATQTTPGAPEWFEVKDQPTGKSYYWHKSSGKTSWTKPDGPVASLH